MEGKWTVREDSSGTFYITQIVKEFPATVKFSNGRTVSKVSVVCLFNHVNDAELARERCNGVMGEVIRRQNEAAKYGAREIAKILATATGADHD